MQPISDPRPAWTPTLATLPGGALVRITSVRAGEIVFDRVADLDGTTLSTAHGVPISGYDPETDDLPSLETVVAAIANPPAVPAPVPQSVTRRQLKEQLIRMDRIHEVEATVSAIPGVDGRIARNWWAEAVEFRRDHPLVDQLGAALGLSPAEIDAAFVAAAQL